MSFQAWFEENRNGEFLADMYAEYVNESEQMGFLPDPFELWAEDYFYAEIDD